MGPSYWPISVTVAGAVAMCLIGLADDLSRGRGINVGVRAVLQITIALGISGLLVRPDHGSWWAVALGGGFIAAFVNFTNFMDGVNWISGLYGLVAGGAFAAIGWMAGQSWLLSAGLILAALYVAFLPWNILGSGMFLGDVGSYLLGALVSGTAVAAVVSGIPVLTAFGPLAIYLADTVTVLVRRAIRGEPVLKAHRTHAYQRLTNVGCSHGLVALIVGLLTAATSVVGLLHLVLGWPWQATAVVQLAVCAAYVTAPRLLGDELPALPNKELEPIPDTTYIAPRPGYRPRRWAVAGASGFIGSAVVARLRHAGIEVVAWRAPRLQLDPEHSSGREVAEIAAKYAGIEELARGLNDVEVVVNAAGLATPDASPTRELYGANSMLPAVLANAARAAGVTRFIHLSSAAVQGRRPILDETTEVSPFSPYSRSKALGESTLISDSSAADDLDVVIVRATSVQGEGRGTTNILERIAKSPWASVASPGDQPTVVSTLPSLTDLVYRVGTTNEGFGCIVLQPWEGMSVADVLRKAGGKEPRRIPRVLCRLIVNTGFAVGRIVPEATGSVRRIELMWFGQRQSSGESTWRVPHHTAGVTTSEGEPGVRAELSGPGTERSTRTPCG